MNILILGGTGVISRAITKEAVQQGNTVTLFNRGLRKVNFDFDTTRIKTIVGDRTNNAQFVQLLSSEKPDVVIDMISFNKNDAKQTLDVFSKKCGQIIFTSSSSVYAHPYKTFPIKEDEEILTNDPTFPYGFEKAEMEKFIWNYRKENTDTCPVIIIRPSLTFGEGCMNIGVLRQNANIIYRIRNHQPLVMPGDGTALWAFTFAPDLAKGYLLCCGNKKAFNNSFQIANDELCIWQNLYDVLGEIVGIQPEYVYVPSAILNKAKPDLFAHFQYEKKYATIFDMSKIKSICPEFKCSISLKDGMNKILNWWDNGGLAFDKDKNDLEDKIVNCVKKFEKNLTQSLN